MKRLIFLLAVLCSCDDVRQRYVCDCDDKNKISQFITDNIGKANNMSDEEMEDVIRELRYTAIAITCKSRFIHTSQDGSPLPTQLDSCETIIGYPFP